MHADFQSQNVEILYISSQHVGGVIGGGWRLPTNPLTFSPMLLFVNEFNTNAIQPHFSRVIRCTFAKVVRDELPIKPYRNLSECTLYEYLDK